MIKFLEAIFRRFPLLILMLFVPIIISLWVSSKERPSYQSSATLWAIQRYEIPGGTSHSNMPTTPASTQSAVLSELLQSRAFDIAVGDSTDLKSLLSVQSRSNSQVLGDAYHADISKNVQVNSLGNNSYQIKYISNNPDMASEVVNAVINQFRIQVQPFRIVEGQQFNIIEGQQLMQGYQSQLKKVQKDVDTTTNNELAYRTTHPGVSDNDLHYALLDSRREQALSRLTNLQTTIDTLSQQIAATQSTDSFNVLDPPSKPVEVSRTKPTLIAGMTGSTIGIVVCTLYIIILVCRDRALYTQLDVERVASYPLLLQIPRIRSATHAFYILTSSTNGSSVMAPSISSSNKLTDTPHG